MRECRFRVLSEGPHEVGGGGEAALPRLVTRLLGGPSNAEFEVGLLRNYAHIHSGSGFAKKVQAAMRMARNEGFDGLAVVVDRDGRKNSDRLRELIAGRDSLSPTLGVACAVGVAVEAFDAWMIADRDAMAIAAGGAGANPQAHRDPETLNCDGRSNDAKAYAQEQLGGGLAEKYAVIAEHCEIALLERQCSKGFGAFAAEVRTHLLPVVEAKRDAEQ